MFDLSLKKDKEDYPKLMHPHIDILVSDAKSIEDVEVHVHVGLAFQARFAEQFEKCSLAMWGGDGVALHIVTDNMPDVLPALRWLRHKGYRCHIANEAPASRSKTWTFGLIDPEGNTNKWHIQVQATLSTGSVKCEYIQVGVREEPIMELRCEGGRVETGTKELDVPVDLK